MILLAGPIAGFLFAGTIILGLVALGRFQAFELDWIPVRWLGFDYTVQVAVVYLLFVNIVWGLVNLLPIYPLDGGRIARELFTLANPRRGITLSLQLSIAAAAVVAAYALSKGQFYTGIMFGLLAFSSFQALQRYSQRTW